MNIHPGYDKTLIRIVKAENKTAHGVYLPGNEQVTESKILLAEVVAVGPTRADNCDFPLIPGNHILIPALTPIFHMKDSPLMTIGECPDTSMIRTGDIMARVTLDGAERWPAEQEAVGAAL